MDINEIHKEKDYLNKVIEEIDNQKSQTALQIDRLAKEKKQFSEQFSEDYYEMDEEEALGEGDTLAQFDMLINYANKQLDKLNRQEYSPYFGRVDFKDSEGHSYYIGVNNLSKLGENIPLICDWRAPVSSVFYDYELGNAKYISPNGVVDGTVTLKRQYKIKDRELTSAFDSSLTIGDDILQDVLSQNASNKMRTIVSTIQKEQNKVIRSNTGRNMLVQGVAGSGKTSIALHRIAYLLYENKETLKAEDILILSPNTLFSEYISEVLPELGEENMSQMSFYRLAIDELHFLNLKFETREEMLDELINNKARSSQVAYKNSYDFYESLVKFCEQYFSLNFVPYDLKFGTTIIKSCEMENLYFNVYKNKTPAVKVEWIVDYIVDKLNISVGIKEIAEKIKKLIYPFFASSSLIDIYSNFLKNINMELKLTQKDCVCYDDLGALLYLKNYFFGMAKRNEVKYLIIDEMQDYSFVQYDVFNQIFDCNKTILGDINQCIEKIMNDDDLDKLKIMLNADLIELKKAYRSTYEINEYAESIKGITTEKVDRHGDKPLIVMSDNFAKSIEQFVNDNANYNSIAILTKNLDEAKKIYFDLQEIEDISLVTSADEEIKRVSIMPAYLSKGLEFDMVIIPNIENNYNSFIGRNLLYISSTRALHKLIIINKNIKNN